MTEQALLVIAYLSFLCSDLRRVNGTMQRCLIPMLGRELWREQATIWSSANRPRPHPQTTKMSGDQYFSSPLSKHTVFQYGRILYQPQSGLVMEFHRFGSSRQKTSMSVSSNSISRNALLPRQETHPEAQDRLHCSLKPCAALFGSLL